MKEAVDGICASVAYYYDYSRTNITKSSTASLPKPIERGSIAEQDSISLSMSTMDALALTWSLHCAIAMRHVVAEDQREWMAQVLHYAGSRMRIPKAMALVSFRSPSP
jgi:hypothetical protein